MSTQRRFILSRCKWISATYAKYSLYLIIATHHYPIVAVIWGWCIKSQSTPFTGITFFITRESKTSVQMGVFVRNEFHSFLSLCFRYSTFVQLISGKWHHGDFIMLTWWTGLNISTALQGLTYFICEERRRERFWKSLIWCRSYDSMER